MFTSDRRARRIALLVIVLPLALSACQAEPPHSRLGLGTPVSEADVAAWNIDVSPSGGLPPGHGLVAAGRELFETNCAPCHGLKGEGLPPFPRLTGGHGSLATAKPVLTIGSFWPYAETVFDYIRRAMPFVDPQSLDNDQVYALTAYLLYLNGIVPESTDLDAARLAAVRMPNRDGFILDNRPDTR